MEKVFIVRITQVYDFDELRNDVKCFSTKERAVKYAKDFIEDEKDCLQVELESGYWIEDDNLDTNGEWEAYHEGCYCQDHTNVSIFEEKVN